MTGRWTEGNRARIADLTASVENRLNAAPVGPDIMELALTSGEATPMGDFPASPVRYRSIWWVRTGMLWRAVDDHAQAQFDEDADRYQLAIASVDGLTAMALAHPVSQQRLLEFVRQVTVEDLPERVKRPKGAAALWTRLDAPAGCGAWVVAWPPGATSDWHHHGEAIGAFSVLDGGLEFAERTIPTERASAEYADLPEVVRSVHAGQARGIAVGQGHLLRNPADRRTGRWTLSAHAGWLVHPLSCHSHVAGAIRAETVAPRSAA